MKPTPRLLVSVGTDFHPFNRVVGWVDSWLEHHPDLKDAALVQHGASRPSRQARNVDLLSFADLQAAMRGADIVISHGGPATIFEARRHGHVPLCMPRLAALGEHVDGHQQTFVRYLGKAGLVRPVETESGLHRELDRRLLDAAEGRTHQSETVTPAGAEGLAQLVAELVDMMKGPRRPGLRDLITDVRRLVRYRRQTRHNSAPTRLSVDRAPQGTVHADLPIIGYVILSHQPDLRLERLVCRIRELDPDARIHVNHNSKGAGAITPAVRKTTDSIVLSPGGRGDFSHIRRQLHSSRIALEDPVVDYIIVISGEDYPCASLISARCELAGVTDGFLKHTPALDPTLSPWPQREVATRYFYRWTTLFRHSPRIASILHPLHAANFIQPWVRFNTVYGGLRVGLRGNPPPGGLQLYAGSAWSALSRRAVEVLDETLREGSAVAQWAARILVADEVVVPSVVASSPALQVADQRKFFVDFFQTRHGRATYLDSRHLPAVLSSNAWFCRKVASSEFMDELDRITKQPGDVQKG